MKALATMAAWLLPLQLAAAPASIPDPTQPAGIPAAADADVEEREVELTSILVSGDRRIAVINGQLVREGERVDGIAVRRIEPHAVQLDGADGAFTLRLSGAAVKHPPSQEILR
jgi:MSHA biogenesis protein MshK